MKKVVGWIRLDRKKEWGVFAEAIFEKQKGLLTVPELRIELCNGNGWNVFMR